MIDIANAFALEGFQVTLITGRLVQRSTPLNHSIELEKIIKYNRKSIFSRIISWLVGIIQILYKIKLKYSDSFLFIVSNPPIAPLIPLICKNKYSLLIYDVYIEKLEEYLILREKSLIAIIWKRAHSKIFKYADNIYTLTDGMKKSIEKYSLGKSCNVVPIWTDNEFLKPISYKQNTFIIENNLESKFIILYSGNIGASSGVEHLIDIALDIEIDDIIFVIIGDGIYKRQIVNKVNEQNIKNCIFLPWQPVEMLPYSLSSANIAVVSLIKSSQNSAIPSKMYNYLSVGAPILCLADPESDIYRFVQNKEVGKSFKPSNRVGIKNFIQELYNYPNEQKRYGQNSLTVSKDFTKVNAMKFVLDMDN